MSKNAQLYFVAPVVLGFFAFACFASPSEKTSTRGQPTASRELAIHTPLPADDLQLLRARVAGLEAERLAAQPAAPMIGVAAPPSAPSPQLERRLPEPASLQAHYDAAFAAESADGRWAPGEENAVVAFFATGSAPGARLEKAECRESLCRIRVHFDDPNARGHFLSQIGLPPFDHGGFYRTDEATGAFTLYTARAGRTLPSVESTSP